MAFNYTWTEYNNPNITAGFWQGMEYASNVTAGYLGIGIEFSLWIILYLVFKRWGDMEALMSSSFITFIISSLMYLGGILDWKYAIIPLIGTALFFIIGNRRKE